MKKKILLVVLAVVMLSFVGCNRDNYVCDYPNVVITGRIINHFVCSDDPETACITMDVVAVVNDAGIFVLVKDGRLIYDFSLFGDRATICGTYTKAVGYQGVDFYFLTISRVIR